MHWNNHTMTLPGLAPPEDENEGDRPPSPFAATRTLESHGEFVRPYLRRGATVLDMGCGHGTLTGELAQTVFPGSVWAIDREPDQIARARRLAEGLELVNASFAVARSETLPFADGTFDLVFAGALPAGRGRRHEVLAEICRVLKPGGLVALACHDRDGLRLEPGSAAVARAVTFCRQMRAPGTRDQDGSLADFLQASGLNVIHDSALDLSDDDAAGVVDHFARQLDDVWRPSEANALRDAIRVPGASLLERWRCVVARAS